MFMVSFTERFEGDTLFTSLSFSRGEADNATTALPTMWDANDPHFVHIYYRRLYNVC